MDSRLIFYKQHRRPSIIFKSSAHSIVIRKYVYYLQNVMKEVLEYEVRNTG